ncbi:MAG: hypothetical protein CM15mP111_4230 [Hyphomicrobiales bacterium]|nr:MAG: hypothetical protein CM15mP111_4230 [Hyphomicrobiales bacterium]
MVTTCPMKFLLSERDPKTRWSSGKSPKICPEKPILGFSKSYLDLCSNHSRAGVVLTNQQKVGLIFDEALGLNI